MAEKYPTCQASLKDGSPCKSAVVNRDAEPPWSLFCLHHARQAADADEDAPVDDEEAVEDTIEDAPIDEAVTAAPRVTPRDSIREFALANPHLVDEFLKGVLAATQDVWVSCPSCKKRSSVPAPNWSARTKAVELLLEQGFGRPEPAPPDDDEKLRTAVQVALRELSDETLQEVAGLSDWQRRLLSLPLDVQIALFEAYEDEVLPRAERRHGYSLAPA